MKKRYGMVIDLKKCIGCDACTIGCRQAKATSRGILFGKVFKYERGKYPNAKLGFLPVLCMHCVEPPCEKVCPTGATRIEDDGIVVIDAHTCIGCKYCIVACPYGARNAFRGRVDYFEGRRHLSRPSGRANTFQEQPKSVTSVQTACAKEGSRPVWRRAWATPGSSAT